MLEIIKNESKNKEEALNIALEKLNVNQDEVYYYFEEENALFGKKKYKSFVITKYAVKDYIREFLKELASYMNMSFDFEVNERDGIISVFIISSDNALMIGKDGKNLQAMQTILRQHLRLLGNFNIKLNLDIAGYKERKEEILIREVKKLCREVMKTKIDVKLDPMNSYMRRIVHNVVSGYSNLVTESVGEEPNRYVIIKYKED